MMSYLKQSSRKGMGFVGTLAIASLVLLASCGRSGNDNRATTGTGSGTAGGGSTVTSTQPGINALDNQFLVKAAQDNLFEIQAGRLPAQKGARNEVVQFAQMMIRDHTNATKQLSQLASANNVTLPTDMGAENRAIYDRLNGLSGIAFERAYMTEMVNAHRKDVALFQNQANQGQKQQIKDKADQLLPTLQRHLDMAQRLSSQVNSNQ